MLPFACAYRACVERVNHPLGLLFTSSVITSVHTNTEERMRKRNNATLEIKSGVELSFALTSISTAV